MLSEGELYAAAARLAVAAGLGRPESLSAMSGGKNNRVFQVAFASGETLVLKNYHADPRDPRDRLWAEWTFLTYLETRSVGCVPKPLAQERETHTALYTFIRGRKLEPAEIGDAEVRQAAGFILDANRMPRDLAGLAAGSEACFSMVDHLATVDRRVLRLASLDSDAPLLDEAERWVRTALAPAWDRIRSTLSADGTPGSPLPIKAQCASPSDFGFHNVLVDRGGRASFIDFEYAGRDDPAKLVCDFFCCPEIPVPIAFLDGFVAALADGLDLDQEFAVRCHALLDVYRIKWACIVMNEFLAVGAARRDFANAQSRRSRCRAQLDKAAAKLAEIGSR